MKFAQWFKKVSSSEAKSHSNYNFPNNYNLNNNNYNIDSINLNSNNNLNVNKHNSLGNKGDLFSPLEGPEYRTIDFLANKANTYASRLFFNRPFAADSGVYVCFAKNWKNFTYKEYRLRVLDDNSGW